MIDFLKNTDTRIILAVIFTIAAFIFLFIIKDIEPEVTRLISEKINASEALDKELEYFLKENDAK